MNHQKSGYLYLLATLIFFSTYEVVSKTLVGKIGPYEINFIRFLIGERFLFLVLVVKKDVRISPRDLFLSTVVGILNVVISMSLAQLSIFCEGAKASVVAVIFSANPIFVMLFSALFNKERLSVNKLLGFVFGVAGLAVIFLEKGDFRFANYASPLLALSSALVFGLYTVLGGKVASRMGSLKMNAYSFIFGSLVLLPLVFATGGSFFGHRSLGYSSARLPRRLRDRSGLSFLLQGTFHHRGSHGLPRLFRETRRREFLRDPSSSASALRFISRPGPPSSSSESGPCSTGRLSPRAWPNGYDRAGGPDLRTWWRS